MQHDPSSQQYVPPQEYVPAQHYSPRTVGWSALAITGFVCALLGFLGFTAILGIIFGIAGIVATRGGRKRGMGLAIAAIPISLVTGAFCVFFVFMIFIAAKMFALPQHLRPALSADDPTNAAAIADLREAASEDFNSEVSDDQLKAWLVQVREAHGKLVELKIDNSMKRSASGNESSFEIEGKFVNGPATVHLTMRAQDMFSMKFNDVDIGGVSPRDLK
jgi:hypothetical protein